MNLTIITGNIGAVKDVVSIEKSSSKVLNFSVAVNKHFTKEKEKVTETIWFECSLWNRENVFAYLKPGTHVTMQGEVGVKAYIKDEKAVGVLTFNVESIEFTNKEKTSE